MAQGLGTKTGIKKRQKKKDSQGQVHRADPGKANLSYLKLRNQFLEYSQEELLAIAEEEQERPSHRFADNLPEEEDEESWEPEEEEYLSDDWDPRRDDGFTDDRFSTLDLTLSPSHVTSSQQVSPAVIVSREQGPTGVTPEVRLANVALLGNLLATWRQTGQEDRAAVLEYRLSRLLAIARYIVEQQKEFLLQRGPRRPLEAVEVAKALWPRENVTSKKGIVSHLTNGKALRTPWDEVISFTDLLPSTADCLPEHICSILREYDDVRETNGRRVAQEVISVDSQTEDSIVKQLHQRWRQWLGHTDGLSAENVKHVMKRNNIPRVASERKAAYEQGKAWWIATR